MRPLFACLLLCAAPAFAQPKTTLNVGMAAQDVGQLDPHFAVSTIDRVPAAYGANEIMKAGHVN